MQSQRAEILEEIEQQRFRLNLTLLTVYNYYRAFVGFALLAVFSQNFFETRLGSLDTPLFWWTAIIYTLTNVASAVLLQVLPRHWFES